MKTGLFFGSFNPIHKGHIEIAEFIINNSDIEEIWFVVSPENPWKTEQKKPASDVRLMMVELAIKNKPGFKATNFEEQLPKPSYTYQSLQYLRTTYPKRDFILLIGGDNLAEFRQWGNYEKILSEFKVWAYPRNETIYPDEKLNIKLIDAPLLNYSSTAIRENLKNKAYKETRIDNKVLKFIAENKLYQS